MADAKIMTFGELFSATTDVIPDNKAAAVEIEGLDGNDYIKINTTNGSEAVELVSSGVGRVGINQAAPTEQLHISAGSSGAAYVKFTDGTSGHADGEGMHIGLAGSNRMTIWNKEDGIMMFGTNNTEAMRIAADGKVGINDTAPTFTPGWLASDEWLTIKGAAGGALFLERTGSTARKWGVGINTAGAFIVSDDTGSTAPFVIDTAGDVGIGTTNPAAPLHVKVTDDSSKWLVRVEADGTTQNALNLIVDGTVGTGARFDLGGNPCSWLNNGNIGFGTTSPDNTKLHLQKEGTAKSTVNFLTIENTVNAAVMDGTGSAIHFKQYYYDAGSPATEDSAKIIVATETDWTSTASTRDSYMAFETSDGGTLVPRMRITSAGKVGIGIDDPISRLHIYENNSNTDATLGLTIEQDGTGDALLQFLLTQQQRWIMGIDHSDGDKFKIAETTDLGTDDFFAIDTSGNVVIVGSCSADGFVDTSDERIKENITDAPSQWDDLKAIQFKKYNMINGGEERIGCVAQDLESILPELVATREGVETLHGIKVDGVKGIKQSILVMKAMKALQEALLRIEVLESRLNEGN